MRSDVNKLEGRLFSSTLPRNLVKDFINFNQAKIINHNSIIKNRLINKFNRLKSEQMSDYKSFFNNDRSKWIVNLSDKQTPEHISKFLSLGDKFDLPINQQNKKDRLNFVFEVVKNFEFKSFNIPYNTVDGVRGWITSSLNKFLNKKRHQSIIDKHILYDFSKCKQFLKNNSDVFVTKADKGQLTVIMNKNKYIDQMKMILNDQTTYKKLQKDPINKMNTKLHNLIKSWRDNDIIDVNLYRHLNCTNGNIPRCYGLPKIHKIGYPLRVIVSALGSPLYNVARYFHNILYNSIPRPKSRNM